MPVEVLALLAVYYFISLLYCIICVSDLYLELGIAATSAVKPVAVPAARKNGARGKTRGLASVSRAR